VQEGPLCQVPPEGRAPRGNRHTRGERLPRGPKSLGRHRQGMGGRHRGGPRHHDPSPDSLRPEPGPSAPKQARDRHAASEPAWRLLHAVTLRQFHQARTRVHMAHHAQGGPHEAKRATPGTSSAPSASASQARYMTRPSTPCEASPSPRQGRELPRPQGRLRDSQPRQERATPQPAQRRASHPARCTRLHAHTRHSSPPPCQSRAAAEGRWALAVEDITADGSRTTRMRASGAIATAATHGARHSECVAARRQEGMPGGRQEGAPQRRPATQAPSPLDPHGAPPETSCRREKARRGGERRTGASRVTTFGCWRG